jgi:hypothetical protein
MNARTPAVTALALGLAACGGGSPTAPPPPANPAPAPAPSAAPPPAAPANQPPRGVFRINPDPVTGEAPFDVRINMCLSTDADAGDTLRFTADFGDGVEKAGRCALEHTYDRTGSFSARACVTDGQPGDGHTQCQTFRVTTTPKNLPPDVSNLRVFPRGHSTSTVQFALWDDQEPARWTASVRAGTPGTHPGCFEVSGRCTEVASGEASVGVVEIVYRDGIAGPSPGRHFVVITIRSQDAKGRDSERSVEYTVF